MNGVHCQTSARMSAKKFHGALGQPADRHLVAEELAEDVVGRAERPLQQQRPGLADDHRADEERHDQDRHDQAAAAEVSHHASASAEAEQELDGDARAGEHRRHRERPARHGVVHHLLEVLQADEGVAGDLEVVIDEGDPEREQQRIDRQREDEQHRRRDQQPLEMAVGPERRAPSSA